MWGLIPSAGVGPIVPFNGNVNASRWHALSHLRKETMETPKFMQDYVLCYKAKTVLSFLEEEGIAVIKWPP